MHWEVNDEEMADDDDVVTAEAIGAGCCDVFTTTDSSFLIGVI
jgi:hypothetical protein